MLTPKKQTMPKSKNDLRREHMEKRRKVKRRRRILAYCIIIFVLLIIFTILAFTVFFRIGEINITGKTTYSREEIISASELDFGDKLYLFSTEKAEERIKDALPYIEDAEITRKISGKVSINLTTLTPAFVIQYGEKYALLADNGKVLEICDKTKIKGKTLIVTGKTLKEVKPGDTKMMFSDEADGKSETAEIMKTIITAMDGSGLKDIIEINIKNKADITMTYQNRITLKFGSVVNMKKKVKLAKASLENEDNISFDQKGILDLRVNGEAVFSPKEE